MYLQVVVIVAAIYPIHRRCLLHAHQIVKQRHRQHHVHPVVDANQFFSVPTSIWQQYTIKYYWIIIVEEEEEEDRIMKVMVHHRYAHREHQKHHSIIPKGQRVENCSIIDVNWLLNYSKPMECFQTVSADLDDDRSIDVFQMQQQSHFKINIVNIFPTNKHYNWKFVKFDKRWWLQRCIHH